MFDVSQTGATTLYPSTGFPRKMCPHRHIFLLDRYSFDITFVQSLAPRLELLFPQYVYQPLSLLIVKCESCTSFQLPASFNSLQLHEFPAIRLCRTGNIIPYAGIHMHTVSTPSYSTRSYKLTRCHEHCNTVQQEKRNITFIIQLYVATYMHSYVCMGNLRFDLSRNCSKLCDETGAVS